MNQEQDFIAAERAEAAALMAEAGAPARPNQQPQATPQTQQPQRPPIQKSGAHTPLSPGEDAGLSQQVFVPPGMEQYAQDQVQPRQDPNLAPTPQQAQSNPGLAPNGDAQQQNHQPGPPPGVLEERQRRQDAERRLDETRNQQQRLSDRLDMLNEVIRSSQDQRLKATQETALPDPNEDLQGYVQGLNQRYQDELGNLKTQNEQVQQHLAQTMRETQIRNIAQQQAQAYQQEHPDFQQAYQFYTAQRTNQLKAQGFDEATVARAVQQEEMNLAEAHLQDRRNVAQAIHEAAKAMGWNVQQQPQHYQYQQGPYTQQLQQDVRHTQQQMQQPQAYQPAQNPMMQLPPQYQQQPQLPAPQPQPGQPGYQQPMATMQAGMMSGHGLADMSQTGAAMTMSLESYANMPDAQFAQHMDEVKRRLESGM